MSIFVIFRVTEPEKLRSAIETHFSDNFFDLGHNEWIIAAKGTAKDISDKLGITDAADVGSAIVFSMDGYFGRAPSNIWEWIKTKADSSDG